MDLTFVEQDHPSTNNGNDPPSYEDLAAQNGPNSRFGRWRGWIEKRAAERYADITPEERTRRRLRGWGLNDEAETSDQSATTSDPVAPPEPLDPNEFLAPTLMKLRIQTDLPASVPLIPRTPSPPFSVHFVSQKISPSHLKISHFGSRFLPHTTSPIRCLLPLESDRLLLIGHDEGLSILNMFPEEITEDGFFLKGPDEAQARQIWQGESVCHISLLELEDSVGGVAQGVVLMLVGAETQSPGAKDSDTPRSLRMYNLASLVSLAKWAMAEKAAQPLDLRRPSNWQAQTPPRRHKQRDSIARGLETLIGASLTHHLDQPPSAYPGRLSPFAAAGPSANVHSSINGSATTPGRLSPNRRTTDSTWEVVDDLPLRWATDFVPLGSSGSRLANALILSYALWGEGRKGKGGRLLAVATKSNILLYETPKGERAFRFVKEFYTPLQPRSVTFFQQSVQDVHGSSHKRTNSTSTLRGASDRSRRASSSSMTLDYGTHLSLFVVFDKKAGWIRLADSAVGELELYDNCQGQQYGDFFKPSRSRMSVEGSHISTKWIPPIHFELPQPDDPDVTTPVYLLTCGKQTHVVPSPLRCSSTYPPLHVLHWNCAPTSIAARICEPTADSDHSFPFLQVIAFSGENGIEVLEISLSSQGKGKQKARLDEPIRAEEDLGGDVGFLHSGGHWDASDHRFLLSPQNIARSTSTSSGVSMGSMESAVLKEKLKREEGVYGWYRKGVEDWRVFWLGGSAENDSDDS